METRTIDGMRLFFDNEDRAGADVIGQACARTTRLHREHWGLEAPPETHVYVMTSWLSGTFRAAPPLWKALLVVTFPLWAPRARRLWPFAGGWAQRYGRRRTVCVKPPRLMAQSDQSMGLRIFVPADSLEDKVGRVTCHELTHAYTEHLKPLSWLHEGLAMVAVDRFAEQPTVRPETVEVLARRSTGARPVRRLQDRDPDTLTYQYVQGYWLTRYFEETHPGLLKELLSAQVPPSVVEKGLADACGLAPDEFWAQIDGLAVAHFA
jgi:hypothetical protein